MNVRKTHRIKGGMVNISTRVPRRQKSEKITNIMPIFPEICTRPHFPLVISAYTVTSHLGGYYKKTAHRLTRSLIEHDMPHLIYPLKGTSNWVANCALKPTIILYTLRRFKCPILWIDIDGEVFQYPQWFENPPVEMALCSQNGHWLSGTLYLRESTEPFIKKWGKVTTNEKPDEITLLNLYRNSPAKHRPRLKMLPNLYNTVVHSKTNTSRLFIGHHIRPDVAGSRGVKSIKP